MHVGRTTVIFCLCLLSYFYIQAGNVVLSSHGLLLTMCHYSILGSVASVKDRDYV